MAIAVSDWGKDHWSLLGYLMTRAADYKAAEDVFSIDRRHLRCNTEKHPLLSGSFRSDVGRWKPEYATRLAGYWKENGSETVPSRQVAGHDDWDCLDDLAAAGLVEIISLVNAFARMTNKGAAMGARLMAHKATGGHFGTFVLRGKEGTR